MKLWTRVGKRSAVTEQETSQAIEARRCGRPTKSGAPCRTQLYHPSEVACGKHATEHDLAITEAYRRGWRDAFDLRRDVSQSTTDGLKQRIEELERQLDDAQRYFEQDGDQVVEVGRYAYRWGGNPPLEVGERVRLPQNWLSEVRSGPGTYEGVVAKLGATYRGQLSRILGRADPSA